MSSISTCKHWDRILYLFTYSAHIFDQTYLYMYSVQLMHLFYMVNVHVDMCNPYCCS